MGDAVHGAHGREEFVDLKNPCLHCWHFPADNSNPGRQMQFGFVLLPQLAPGMKLQLATGVQAPQYVSDEAVHGPWICLPISHDVEQTLHAVEPAVAAKLTPAAHAVQSTAEPSPLAYFPEAHSVHAVEARLGLYVPIPQAVQMEKPVDEVYIPEAQPVHTAEELPPVAVVKVPAAQPEHTVTPLMLVNVPAAQGVSVPAAE